ncbi:hypothetical protein SAMN06265337_1629 [Hymenobacter gelipurpurascens]|uniref:Uncharacterized protein n=1 Tax=Hymenobacter gelipurpurascens TaxID=89968 RepID=A0A212TKJ2_9BACT|nr:hypothetical protein SAMN06265337_1629 [Hymenobacter gelipurpurascens]
MALWLVPRPPNQFYFKVLVLPELYLILLLCLVFSLLVTWAM